MPDVASRTTRVTLEAAKTITSGSIKVYGIKVSNGTASNVVVQFLDNDDTNILDIAVLAYSSDGWDVSWIVDNGLKVASESDASVVVTVAHTSDGV